MIKTMRRREEGRTKVEERCRIRMRKRRRGDTRYRMRARTRRDFG